MSEIIPMATEPCAGVDRQIVYILTNPSMPGLIKIGRTRNLEVRLAQMSGSTSVPEPFVVVYAAYVLDAPFVERALHVAFTPHRMSGKEFFRMSPEYAIAALSLAEIEQVSLAVAVDPNVDVINEIRQRGKESEIRKHQVKSDIVQRLRDGEEFTSQDDLAAHYQVPKTSLSDWLRELEEIKQIRRIPDGRCKRLTAA